MFLFKVRVALKKKWGNHILWEGKLLYESFCISRTILQGFQIFQNNFLTA